MKEKEVVSRLVFVWAQSCLLGLTHLLKNGRGGGIVESMRYYCSSLNGGGIRIYLL